jgi:hypothetical protein
MIQQQTTLDLNGPILGFSTHPQNPAINNAGITTFIGIATAYFTDQNPTNIFSSNTGIVTYRWYAAGIGALSDGSNATLGATLSGTATTTLTVSNVTSPTTNKVQFYVGADYIPSAYQSASPVTAGTARSTGNAINEELFSNTATLTVRPVMTIVTNPSDATAVVDNNATFNALGALTDESQGNVISYQWSVNGSTASNGTTQTTSSATNFSTRYTSNSTITIPDDATNVRIRIFGAAGGYGGTDTNGSGGNGGNGKSGTFSLPDGGRTLDLYIGGRGPNANNSTGGSSSVSAGGRGGSGNSSGQGGAGGGGTFVFDRLSNTYILAAGSGAGGGGGSYNESGTSGGSAGGWQSVSGGLTGITAGSAGGDSGGTDGGGGGGGGGGYRGGNGGSSGQDNPPPPPPPPPPPSGGGGRSGCFTAETKILMLNGVEKPISEINVGDYVINKDGTSDNQVVFIEKHINTFTKIYSPTLELKPFATTNHMLYKDGQWIVVDNYLYAWLDECQTIENAIIEPVGNQEVYNLWVTGDGTYTVNGYGTHSIMFDGGFMRNAYDQKLISYDDVIGLMKEFANEKLNLLYGSVILNRIVGKINNPILNKICANIILSDDKTIRKQLMQQLMKIVQGVVK